MSEYGNITALYLFGFVTMKKILSVTFTIIVSLMFSACSTTTSDVHQIIDSVDSSSIKGLKLVVGGDDIQRTFQTSSRIYSLHQSAEEVKNITALVANRYGFEVLGAGLENSADFYINLTAAMPDGGTCIEGLSSAAKNLSYTGSVLTLGIAPVSGEHCLIVVAELYQYQGNERVLIGEFRSNLGRVEVYAGANEIDNYQLTVDKRDEIRSLEVSLGGLLRNMISEEAFQQEFQ